MLQNEITPFADHHIEKLDEVHALLLKIELAEENDDTIAELLDARNKIVGARNALVRFKVCMEDEWSQKKNLQQFAHNCRMNHK